MAPPFIHNPFTELEYSLTSEGNFIIRHKATGLYEEILKLNATSASVDSHFAYVINKSGEVLGASMKYVKGLLLQSPVPIFKLAEIPDDQKLSRGDYTLHVATERTLPKKMTSYLEEKLTSPQGQKMYVDKGDLIVYDQNDIAIEVFFQKNIIDEALAESTAIRLSGLITDPYFYNSEKEIRNVLKG